MTNELAIKKIKERHCVKDEHCVDNCMYGKDKCEYDIALAAMELQIPKQPYEPVRDMSEAETDYACPNCKEYVICCVERDYKPKDMPQYCIRCGQKLDWSREE